MLRSRDLKGAPTMRKEWPWVIFSVLIIYAAALFAGMVKNPHYTGLSHLSMANFIDAQPFAIGAAVFVLISLIVASRKWK